MKRAFGTALTNQKVKKGTTKGLRSRGRDVMEWKNDNSGQKLTETTGPELVRPTFQFLR